MTEDQEQAEQQGKAEAIAVFVEVTTTLGAPFTAGYERLVRSVLAGLTSDSTTRLDVVPVVAKGRTGHRLLTDTETESLLRVIPRVAALVAGRTDSDRCPR